MIESVSKLIEKHNKQHPFLEKNLLLFMRSGSHAYGLNIESSDEDFKGIVVPSNDCLLGFVNKFEQLVSKDPDMTIFSLRKFMALAADNNPNMIEILFTDPSDILYCSKLGELLIEHRDKLLAKVSKHRFSGYAFSQLKRMVHHHDMHKNPPKKKPERKDFNLPEQTLIPIDRLNAANSAIDKKLNQWNLVDMQDLEPSTRQALQDIMAEIITEMSISTDEHWKGAARLIGFNDNLIELLDRERQYISAKKLWDSYQKWMAERNEKRAELEAKFGYDTKHAMHLVRLLRMSREILTTGKVLVKRPDREELLAVRNGAWTLEYLMDWAKTQDIELTEIMHKSVLPNQADRVFLDKLCIDITRSVLEK
jgi:hypothetical protein